MRPGPRRDQSEIQKMKRGMYRGPGGVGKGLQKDQNPVALDIVAPAAAWQSLSLGWVENREVHRSCIDC